MKKASTILLILSSLVCVSQNSPYQIGTDWYKHLNQPTQQHHHFPNNNMSVEEMIDKKMQHARQQNEILYQEDQRLRQQNEYARHVEKYEYVQRQLRQERQQQERQLMVKNLLTNGFPSFVDVDPRGTDYFHSAFAEIDSMLNGTKELNLARSVFLVENAFYGNTLDYFDSHFITKLMISGIGQCYSMPLYYLILAEEMNAEACWALSPKHSFVKIKDKKRKLV